MKLPRDLSGAKRAKALGRVGYEVARRTGSHVRLTNDSPPQHNLIIPASAEGRHARRDAW
jgi:predicted RNA binding protein YcfA (HicA-like mRNA interferase family)